MEKQGVRKYFFILLCTGLIPNEMQSRIHTARFNCSVNSQQNVTAHWEVALHLDVEESLSRGKCEEAASMAGRPDTCACENSQVHRPANTTPESQTAEYNTETAEPDTEVSTMSSSPEPTPGDLGDYRPVHGGQYKLHTKPLNWTDARDVCVREEAHLLVIDSDQQAQIFSTVYGRNSDVIGNNSGPDALHVGVFGSGDNNKWITVLGESAEDIPWASGEPRGMKAMCGKALSNGEVFNANCSDERNFICQKS
ncbi:hemolymph lipopolysaccharide-binding protein [Anabrus simplex]|uniref:hemolymph lipopolysaccharide-binding protein n=1 Tax=Anabrus simplex TaxID=316456 RepID=UPI0035A364C5